MQKNSYLLNRWAHTVFLALKLAGTLSLQKWAFFTCQDLDIVILCCEKVALEKAQKLANKSLGRKKMWPVETHNCVYIFQSTNKGWIQCFSLFLQLKNMLVGAIQEQGNHINSLISEKAYFSDKYLLRFSFKTLKNTGICLKLQMSFIFAQFASKRWIISSEGRSALKLNHK